MTKIHLTELALRQLPFAERQRRYFDRSTPGFGVTVGTRTKTFIVMYGKKRRVRSLGRFPEVSLADARRTAKKLLVSNPPDVSPIKISEAVRLYLEDCRRRLRPGTYLEYERLLRKYRDKSLTSLKRTDVDTSTAHRIMAWKIFCNWCLKHELLDKNPFQYMQVRYGQRSRVLSDDELRLVLAYDDGSEFCRILRLCLLTGQRRTEVASIRQAWIEGDTLTIPASVAKNRKEHTIAFNLLTAQYLPREDGPIFDGFSKAKRRIDAALQLPHWSLHDLRRTFATIHARLGTPIHVVEAMLNHSSGTISGVAAIYIRYDYLKEMRKAAETYELFVADLMAPGQ